MTYDTIIVDGSNALWRSVFAASNLSVTTDKYGTTLPTGGVYGFFQQILSLFDMIETNGVPDVWICWEGRNSRDVRRSIVDTYKDKPIDEKRERMRELVGKQMHILKDMLRYTRFYQAQANGYEADDAMGTIAEKARLLGHNVLIYSGDSDMLQCIRKESEDSGYIHQWKPCKHGDPLWTYERLSSEWSITPKQIIDVKALSGDSADNYAGCKGIGEVWARKMIVKYGSVEDVISNAVTEGEVLNSKKKAENIIECHEYIRKCYDVATIRLHCHIRLETPKPEPAALRDKFQSLKFYTLNHPTKIRKLT